jgi:dTDP-4-dehydrorhamnose reductase
MSGDAKPRILITGASGMLGEALCRLARSKWSVLGLWHRHRVRMPGVAPLQADLADLSSLEALLSGVDLQAVIHTAALAQPSACERDPQGSAALNIQVAERLAGVCAQRRIPFILTSTDLVFDGLQAPYDETRAVSPVCVYGRHKAQAEQLVLSRYPEALVCRLPLMFGLKGSPAASFGQQMLTAIRSGRPLRLFIDEFRTPVDTNSAARGLLSMLGRTRGLLHLGGRSRVSLYELGLLMAKCLGVAPTMLQPVSVHAAVADTVRSPDCSLDSRRAFRQGYDPAPLEEGVASVVAQFQSAS